ncbi:MAG: ATP-dependent DNA helicase RecG [Candidatus Moranbacteria bacterium]|nr:ATP-dependent DNA helicase RecG [Candidatus Moranbacteria bacterium]
MLITPKTKLASIGKITPKYAKILEKLGLQTVEDLLFYFPFRYDDFSKVVPISEKYLGKVVTVEGKIIKTKLARIFRRHLTIEEIVIQDENNIPLKAVWFNQPYILDTLKEGVSVRLSGKIVLNKKFLSMSNPAWERAAREITNTGGIIPVYSETRGLTSKWLRWQIKPLLQIAKEIPDVIPEEIRKKLNLYDIYTALRQIHFPENQEKLLRAQKRFAFEEMFLVQLKTLQVRLLWAKEKSVAIKFDEKLIKDFVSGLPFKLTNAQRKASFEILKDLEKERPMNRLLNGDVGSGKTIVAAIATLEALTAGYQVAIMAPTEVLARQHFLTLLAILRNHKINIALLTSSYKLACHSGLDPESSRTDLNYSLDSRLRGNDTRGNLLKKIKNGEINLIIGTHALIQKDVNFNNLALIIIDEQHRFGVAQRAYLQQQTTEINDGIKGKIPHFLTMTATPIPRTLAIALFGNLDLSILDEMPKDRKKIITKIIPPGGRKEIYNFIREEIKKGRQVFVILPLVEESKILTEVKAATQEYKRLSEEIFPDLKIGLVHGRLKPAEKEKVMAGFNKKELDILVATAVVEVGIDIPNATVMIIEDADRFGLSQLHQFRGRVGRSQHQSYCFLFSTSNSETAKSRLQALVESENGFKIAEKDLELRGPGQFLGTLQSGLPDIAMENLTNVRLIKVAQEEAKNILKSDPALKNHPLLVEKMARFSQNIHLE